MILFLLIRCGDLLCEVIDMKYMFFDAHAPCCNPCFVHRETFLLIFLCFSVFLLEEMWPSKALPISGPCHEAISELSMGLRSSSSRCPPGTSGRSTWLGAMNSSLI